MPVSLASIGPLTPEAILLALGLLLGVAALAFAWLLSLLVCAIIEALSLTLLLAVAWKRRESSHWLWRPLALSTALGVTACGALALNARLSEDDGDAMFWLPLAVAAPFALVSVAAAIVQLVRAIGRMRVALATSARGGGAERARGALRVVARAVAARTLALTGIALGSTGAFGAAVFVALASFGDGLDASGRATVVGFGLGIFGTGALLAAIPWWFAHRLGRAAPAAQGGLALGDALAVPR
jgi:hypothetical protein